MKNRPMPSPFPVSDAIALPALASTGRAEAREKLHEEIAGFFDRFRAPLLGYLLTFGLDIHDGEEVLQEVFLSLCGDLDRGKRIENVRAWLFRVAHNLALRRRYRTLRDAETDCGAETADPAPNPEDRLATRQALELLGAVVEALPEQDRRCLFLRAEGLRYREIAGILEMSLGAVSQSIARSLSRLARAGERRVKSL